MQELRKKAIMEHWVVVSIERGKRLSNSALENAGRYLCGVEVPSLAFGK